MLGDTAVAINAEDERYKHLHGCHVILPLLNKEIPIVCDEHADMTKGTGVVKITPAHDPNDFEVGQRHNLPIVRTFTYDGHLTGAEDKRIADELIASGRAAENEPEVLDCGKYAGMTTMEARKAILEDLKAGGYIKEIEPLKHEVGTCYRCHSTIEPMVSKQWFVRMVPLAKPAIKAVEKGEIKFIPERFTKNYLNWMNGTRDWCISRQLWWGHRIPAWYCEDCGETTVSKTAVDTCPKCGGKHLHQDEDTLDTWFSSALWPFSTLGWPEETEDLKRYFPTDCLVTGYDIIFFWVSRMMFQSLELNGVRPFKDCVIHGLIRDKDGRKMSKSLGNGIDPFDMTEKYGCDALRYYLNTDCALGTDLRFDETKMSATWNYINKIWNASRFVLSNIEDLKEIKLDNLSNEDKWILTKYENIVKSSISHMDRYEFNLFGLETYNFIYDDFCSNYIEFAKFNLDKNSTKSTLLFVLTGILKMLHPFMPFVTEEIYSMLPVKESESIMISSYPIYEEKYIFEKEYELTEKSISFIRKFRNVCTENTIPKTAPVMINNSSDYNLIIKVLRLQDRLINEKENINSYDVNEYNYSMSIFYQKEENLELIKKEMDTLRSNIERREKLLSNPGYVNKAPENLVAMERDKLEIEKNKLKELEEKYK